MSIFSAFSNIPPDQRTTVAHWSGHAPSSNVAWARIPGATLWRGLRWLFVLFYPPPGVKNGAKWLEQGEKMPRSLPPTPVLLLCLLSWQYFKSRILASFLPSSETFFNQLIDFYFSWYSGFSDISKFEFDEFRNGRKENHFVRSLPINRYLLVYLFIIYLFFTYYKSDGVLIIFICMKTSPSRNLNAPTGGSKDRPASVRSG